MQYRFEWNPQKAKENLKKHRISFERAAEIFLDPFMLSLYDSQHRLTEDRWITIGADRNGVPLTVVHTFREMDLHSSGIRIISARRATRNELKDYLRR